MNRRAFLATGLAAAASGCTVGRPTPDYVHYDLGIAAPTVSRHRLDGSLALEEVAAAGWLQTSGILYRLLYRDAARLHAYGLSRWTASPAVLLTQRLRAALSLPAQGGLAMAADGVPTDRVLKVGLDAFEQHVESATVSRAVMAMHVLLVDGRTRGLIGQRSFRIEEPCPSVDAGGAVHGLRAASDRGIVELIDWLAATGRSG